MFTILIFTNMERRRDLKETPGCYKTSKGRKQSTIIENILISTYEWKKNEN